MHTSPSKAFLSVGTWLLGASLLASCGVLGESDRDEQLARHQANAQIYYGGGHLTQALDQVRQGLEIDPDDYKLNTIRGWVLLRQSEEDPERLRDANVQFQRLMELRSMDSHSPPALLGYAHCMQGLGTRHLREYERLQQESTRTELGAAEQAVRRARADEHRAQAKSHLENAERALQRLLDRGDERLLANYHMMQVKGLQRDYDACVRHGHAWLELAARTQQTNEDLLRRTPSLDRERQLMRDLSDLRTKEVAVRTYLANLHYQLEQYDLAVEQLDRVVAMDPAQDEVYYNRALAQRALGRFEEAKRDFQKFLQMSKLPVGHQRMKDAYAAMQELEQRTAASGSSR